MMRPIKFRAWDDERKQMLFFGLLERPWPWNSENEIMQFTGLKDKNGKEIYEGDIVRRRNSNGGIEITEVVFKPPRFNIGDYAKEYGYEVIGNIYENPELLKNV